MFRVKDTEESRGFLLAERMVQVTLVVVLLADFASAYQIYQAQCRLSDWSGNPGAVPSAFLEPLRQDLRIQLITSLVISVILVFCLGAAVVAAAPYLSRQQSFRQVKMLAQHPGEHGPRCRDDEPPRDHHQHQLGSHWFA